MPKPFLSLLLLGGAASAAGAQTQSLAPAEPAEVAASVRSCVGVTGATGPDEAALVAAGWQKATATDARGKPLATPFSVYGRKDGKTMITVAAAKKGHGLCTVMARIQSTEAAKAVVDALSAELKAKPAKVEQSAIYWIADRKVIQLASTGDRSKPGVRVSVMQQSEKSK